MCDAGSLRLTDFLTFLWCICTYSSNIDRGCDGTEKNPSKNGWVRLPPSPTKTASPQRATALKFLVTVPVVFAENAAIRNHIPRLMTDTE